jgi:quinol monooxygenase YgiN
MLGGARWLPGAALCGNSGKEAAVSPMDRALRVVIAVILVVLPFAGYVRAQGAGGKLYVVTHIDVTPDYTADGSKLLLQFAAESRRDPGVVRFELLQDNARSNHFALVEVWENMKAFEGHQEAQHTKRFREKLQPMLGSPFDERLHHLMN